MKILLTTYLRRNWQALATEAGHELLVHPFIRIESTDCRDELQRALVKMPDAQLVVTSMNAVKQLKELRPLVGERTLYCLAGKQTEGLASAGFKVHSTNAGSAVSLAREILSNPPASLIFLAGDRHRPELPDALRAANIPLEIITAYHTIGIDQSVKALDYEAIFFLSPSAVREFSKSNELSADIPVVCIGPTTRAEFKSVFGLECHMAANPDFRSMLATLQHAQSNEYELPE